MNFILFRQIRLMLGLTQREFGEMLGISQAYVGLIETGHRIPTDRIIGRLREEVDADLIDKVDELLNLKITLGN